MKSMVLLIDANVVLDYLLNREPHFQDSYSVISYCQSEIAEGFIAFHSISVIWYVLRKKPAKARRAALMDICEILTVTGASHEAVISAVQNEDFPDFEDCLQEQCAATVHADYIVTWNKADFAASKIPAVTPTEMVHLLKQKNNAVKGE